jgi:hypothetical protein
VHAAGAESISEEATMTTSDTVTAAKSRATDAGGADTLLRDELGWVAAVASDQLTVTVSGENPR